MTTLPAESPAENGSAGAFRMLRDPAVLVITVTGLFHMGRGARADGVVFLSVAVALLVSDLRGGRPPDTERRATGRATRPRALTTAPAWRSAPQTPRWGQGTAVQGRALTAVAVAGAAAGYGWLVGGLAQDGWVVWIAFALPGALAGALAWPQRTAPSRRSGPDGCWAWASVAVLAGLWQLTAFLLQQQSTPDRLYDHPTVSLFIDPLVDSQPGRGVGLAVWLASGYVLLRRAHAANTATRGAGGGRDD